MHETIYEYLCISITSLGYLLFEMKKQLFSSDSYDIFANDLQNLAKNYQS